MRLFSRALIGYISSRLQNKMNARASNHLSSRVWPGFLSFSFFLFFFFFFFFFFCRWLFTALVYTKIIMPEELFQCLVCIPNPRGPKTLNSRSRTTYAVFTRGTFTWGKLTFLLYCVTFCCCEMHLRRKRLSCKHGISSICEWKTFNRRVELRTQGICAWPDLAIVRGAGYSVCRWTIRDWNFGKIGALSETDNRGSGSAGVSKMEG